jgi:hypothetical protein
MLPAALIRALCFYLFGMNKMYNNELASDIDYLFNPEPDEDGFMPREYPHQRIVDHHRLDISYMDCFLWEGATDHPYTRLCSKDDARLHTLDRNLGVADSLFLSGLRLFGNSIIEYHGKEKRKGDLKYYPSVIMTFWSGFEAFVRYTSELMLITVRDVPEVVRDCLSEQETTLDPKGEFDVRPNKYQPVLKRYAVLLRYGYGFSVNRGDTYWQRLENANKLRDYYTHLGMDECKAVSSDDVLNFIEDVMMAIIRPSCELKRTLFLGIYRLYDIWAKLKELQKEPYTEQPFFKDVPFDEGYLFHCNFENVDTSRFPNMKEKRSTGSLEDEA